MASKKKTKKKVKTVKKAVKKAKSAKRKPVKKAKKAASKKTAKKAASKTVKAQLVNFKATAQDRKTIGVMAKKYAKGNASAWMRHSALNYKPAKNAVIR